MNNYIYFNENLINTHRKINSFSDLPIGWHFGKGIKPEQSTINNAISLNEKSFEIGFNLTDSFPGIDGEIQLSAYSKNLDIEMIIENNGNISMTGESNNILQFIYENLTIEQVLINLENLRGKIWTSSIYYTSSTMNRQKEDFVNSHLNPQMTEVEFPLSIKFVQMRKANPYVNTSGSFTQAMQNQTPYIGKFQEACYQ